MQRQYCANLNFHFHFFLISEYGARAWRKYGALIDDALTIEYRLYRESQSQAIGGDVQEEPEELSIEVTVVDDATVRFRAPQEEGAYRIFAFLRNERNQYSVANVPFFIH